MDEGGGTGGTGTVRCVCVPTNRLVGCTILMQEHSWLKQPSHFVVSKLRWILKLLFHAENVL